MLEVKNKVAVITGGASGIGASLARLWVKEGGFVVIGDINEENLFKIKTELGSTNCITLKVDVRSETDTESLAKTAIKYFGGINLVAPCAGVIADMMMVSPSKEDPKKVIKMPLETWKKVIDVNLTGVFLTVRDCLEQMIITDSKGCIILISSTGSLGTAGQINYSSSKAAMSIFPKVLTAELMRRNLSGKIRVNAVAPGYTQTSMTEGMNQKALEAIKEQVPIGRMIYPEEVASLMLEIYRNEAISGEVYFIHGGLRLGSRG